MKSVPVYSQEKKDGLGEAIKAKSSVAYLSPAKLDRSPNFDGVLKFSTVVSNLQKLENPDLFYLKDILVSTGVNLNDDYFDPAEVWAARKTPEDKPFNLNHDCREIIGHMTSQLVVSDDQSTVISEETSVDELPEKFHIVSTSVIYRHWSDASYMKKISDIIAEIEGGEADPKWFVSMEALFLDFDYGILDKNNVCSEIIKRDKKTSHMTKYLRSYGGSGVYKDNRIVRVLRNLIFSGKGLVENPANPESVILTKGEKVDYEKELEAAKLSLEEKNKELEAVTKSKAELEVAVEELKVKFSGLQEELAKCKAEISQAARVETVVEKLKLDKKNAVELVETLASLSDEAFAKYVSLKPKVVTEEKTLETVNKTVETTVSSVREVDTNELKDKLQKLFVKKDKGEK